MYVSVFIMSARDSTLQMAPNTSKSASINVISRKYFEKYSRKEVEDISLFFKKLEEYFLINKIANVYKLSTLKSSLKTDAKIWFQGIASPGLGDTSICQALVNKLKEHFTPVRNRTVLWRKLYGNKIVGT